MAPSKIHNTNGNKIKYHYLIVRPVGSLRGTTPHRWPSCWRPWSWWSRTPYPAVNTGVRPASRWQRSPPSMSGGSWNPWIQLNQTLFKEHLKSQHTVKSEEDKKRNQDEYNIIKQAKNVKLFNKIILQSPWGPVWACRGWRGEARWALWYGSQRRWSLSSWRSICWELCRTRGSRRWWGQELPRSHIWKPRCHEPSSWHHPVWPSWTARVARRCFCTRPRLMEGGKGKGREKQLIHLAKGSALLYIVNRVPFRTQQVFGSVWPETVQYSLNSALLAKGSAL